MFVFSNFDTRDSKRFTTRSSLFKRFSISLYPDISVVQLGINDSYKIDGVNQYIFGENIENVFIGLLKGSYESDISFDKNHL